MLERHVRLVYWDLVVLEAGTAFQADALALQAGGTGFQGGALASQSARTGFQGTGTAVQACVLALGSPGTAFQADALALQAGGTAFQPENAVQNAQTLIKHNGKIQKKHQNFGNLRNMTLKNLGLRCAVRWVCAGKNRF